MGNVVPNPSLHRVALWEGNSELLPRKDSRGSASSLVFSGLLKAVSGPPSPRKVKDAPLG